MFSVKNFKINSIYCLIILFQVNDVPMSTLSHGEAVSFLRRCGPVARLRLYRDNCGTPPSPCATSPTTESDTTFIKKPKPPLR